MGMQLNFSDVSLMGPVPAGTYEVSVNSVKAKTSATKKPMLEWVFQIEEGTFVGRRLFTNTVLQANSLWRTKEILFALGYSEEDLSGEFELDPNELVGLVCHVQVTEREYEGQLRNEVKRVMRAPAATGLVQNTGQTGTLPAWAYEEDDSATTAAHAAEGSDEEGEEGEEGEDDIDFAALPELSDGPRNEPQVPEEYKIPEGIKISDSARRYAMEHRISFAGLTPSGPGKTFVLADVKQATAA